MLCHGCGALGEKLTFEHAPPKRVQQLMANTRYKLVNPQSLISQANRRSEGELPPARAYKGGLGRESFCEACQQKTQTFYGTPYFEWVKQAVVLAERCGTDEGVTIFSARFRPLPVIKQIITSLLAIGDFLGTPDLVRLRAFIQQPRRSGSIMPFAIYAYLNPPNDVFGGLPQSRLNQTTTLMDFTGKPPVTVFAELAYPPLGFVMVWQDFNVKLSREVSGLTDISHFSLYEFEDEIDLPMNMAVRTPFGPFNLRYWQDAKSEPKDDDPEQSS